MCRNKRTNIINAEPQAGIKKKEQKNKTLMNAIMGFIKNKIKIMNCILNTFTINT